MTESEAVPAVVEAVCEAFQIQPAELRAIRRQERYIWPRFTAMYLLRQHTRLSLSQVAKLLDPAVRTHGAVLHGVERVRERMDVDDAFKKTIEGLERRVEEKTESGKQKS